MARNTTSFSRAFFLLVLTLTFNTCLAAVALGPAPINPDNPGECWNPDHNQSYKVGTVWQTTHMRCIGASCVSYRNTLYVQYLT
ncbi:hypothetical protein Pcinc_037566, partial [Petrolisthes cinctipes]